VIDPCCIRERGIVVVVDDHVAAAFFHEVGTAGFQCIFIVCIIFVIIINGRKDLIPGSPSRLCAALLRDHYRAGWRSSQIRRVVHIIYNITV